jgi:hypothetical protein
MGVVVAGRFQGAWNGRELTKLVTPRFVEKVEATAGRILKVSPEMAR